MKVIVEKEMLASLFEKYYNLTNNTKYIFNYSFENLNTGIIVRDTKFKGANYVIKISKKIKNQFLINNVIDECNVLYIRINDCKSIKKIIDLKISKFLRISKIQIIVSIEKIN